MKRQKLLLRSLQTLSGLLAAGIIILLLASAGLLNTEQQNPQNQSIKIKRASFSTENKTYLEYTGEGSNQLLSGNLEASLKSYQKASELMPKEYLPYEKIGDIYMLQKKYSSARQNFEFAETINPSNAGLKIKTVRSLLGMRKIMDAKIKLENIQPQTQASLYYQGLIFAFLNEQTKAKEMLEASLSAGSDEKFNGRKILDVYRDFELAKDAPIEYLQAMLSKTFDALGEYGLAIELAFDALKTQHDYRDVWIVLGHCFLNEKKFNDAEDSFNKAIQLDSEDGVAYFFRAIAKRNLQKMQEAIADFNQALKFGWKPQILAKLSLADIYFEMKDFEKAFPLYKEVVLADPSDITRFVRPMALAINHLNKPAEAEILAKKASEIHKNTAFAENLLGWAAMANNNFQKAKTHLSVAIRMDPQMEAAYLNMGQLEQHLGNIADALKNYQTAMNLSQKSGDSSVGNTAELRYNELINPTAPAGTSTGPTQEQNNQIPSLSLL